MKLKLFEYYVRGRGDFPTDMLRHDQCWPVSGDDAAKLLGDKDQAEHYYQFRTIKLRSVQAPTKLRWSSFLWPANEQNIWGSEKTFSQQIVENCGGDDDDDDLS